MAPTEPPPVLCIENALVVDPVAGEARVRTLHVRDGRFAAAAADPAGPCRTIDARGLVAAPGFVDLHVHLREQVARAAAAGWAEVLPSACLTTGRRGERVADLEALAAAGAACFTDDGATVTSDAVMREAMSRARRLGRVVMDHAQDHAAEERGVMHEGAFSRRWGLPGIPSAAEARVIARDLALARETGCRLHVQHVTSAEGVALLARARSEGVAATAEVTPHHLALCDADVRPDDANFKMNPPLRSADDRRALLDAVCGGTIAALATDHAPHAAAAKAAGFLRAPFGVLGMETAIGATYTTLVRGRGLDLVRWVRLWTTGPAAALGLEAPSLAPGARADLVLMDLETPWTVDVAAFRSRSRNCPFDGWVLHGRAVATVFRGRLVHDALARA